MANLKDIKGRINSVQSTQKITNAMKLVSAAKFSRANHAIESARPYNEAFFKMAARLIASQGEQRLAAYLESEKVSPFLKPRNEKKILVAIFSTDRGLCGALNSNLLKASQKFIAEKQAAGTEVELLPLGRRAIFFSRKAGLHVPDQKEKVLEQPTYKHAQLLGDQLAQYYIEGTYDSIYLAYAAFRTALDQAPVIEKLLPFDFTDAIANIGESAANEDLIIEPRLDEFLEQVLQRLLYGSVYQVLLNGAASEHGARMTAMDAATNNAKEVIRKLTLQYNRARQAAITTELTEIISGAEALN